MDNPSRSNLAQGLNREVTLPICAVIKPEWAVIKPEWAVIKLEWAVIKSKLGSVKNESISHYPPHIRIKTFRIKRRY